MHSRLKRACRQSLHAMLARNQQSPGCGACRHPTCCLRKRADAGRWEGMRRNLLFAPLLKRFRPVEVRLRNILDWIACKVPRGFYIDVQVWALPLTHKRSSQRLLTDAKLFSATIFFPTAPMRRTSLFISTKYFFFGRYTSLTSQQAQSLDFWLC